MTSHDATASLLPALFASYDPVQIERIIIFVEAMLPFTQSLDAKSTVADPMERKLHDRFLNIVRVNLDQRLPFRNLAPSRSRVLQDSGPFSQLARHTISGLFSALVYRGITHNSHFLLGSDAERMEGTVLFHDLQEYKQVRQVACVGKSKSYFCKRNAYGSPAKARDAENAKQYWALACSPNFNSFLAASPRWSFGRLYEHVKKQCRGFGSLTSAQFAIDQAECGNIDPPTVAEIAKLMYTSAGSGSMKGLAMLGYSLTTEGEVESALRSLRHQLSFHLRPHHQVNVKLDIVFIEHLLCKFHRCRRWRGVRQYFEHFECIAD